MKNRIEQLLNGIFEYEPTKLLITEESLRIEAAPGDVRRGSFRVEAADGKKLKGFIYSSSPRLICSPAEFHGIQNEIYYQADCCGIDAGTEEEGSITICSNIGEYELPFVIKMQESTEEEEPLPVTDIAGFGELAKQDFQKAYRVFLSAGFAEQLSQKEPKLRTLYDGLMTPAPDYESLEEFLVGAGLKERLELSVPQSAFSYEELSEPVCETIRIVKNTWGFQQISIESDARFLRPEKKVITTDEFAGSTYELRLVLDTNLMHSGNNYGRIRLSAGGQTLSIEVTARRSGAGASGRQNHIRKIMIKELESLYVSFRLRRIDLATWTERSASVINSYRRAGGDDPFAELFLIQIYFAEGKKTRAFKILESLEAQKERLDTPERYGFYLYMSTFFYQEASYVDRVEEEITRLFYRDKTNWKLLWILLYLKESYLNDQTARYEAVAEQFRCGCRSRIMYLEAYQILKNDPFLMRHLGSYELQLLRFAAKEGVLTAEIIRQAAGLAVHHGSFDRILYQVLSAGYERYPSPDLVKAVCLLLMKGDKKEPEYFQWYALGVEAGLRITGLYEYYMETMGSMELQEMPQVIRMYFAYDTALDYHRRAAVYRRVIGQRDSDPQTFHHYRAAMEKFALDQLEATRISDDLAVLYRTFLRRGMLTKQTAVKLAKLLFTYEVSCSNPRGRRVIVHSSRQKSEQTATFADGKAYIRIYDPDSVLLLEDLQGRRYPADSLSRCRLLEDETMIVWCLEKAPEFPGLLLYLCVHCMETGMFGQKVLPHFLAACETAEFSDEFRTLLRRLVMQYYTEHLREESLPDFLEHIPYLEYVKVDKAALITLLAEEGKCTDAFSLLDAYGAEGIPLLQLVRICSRMVLELEFEENTMLVSLCHYCFDSGKYDDKLLRYLLLYYEGPVREMKSVWQAAVQFDLDTRLLEEKIMTMILFTRSGTQGSEPVFESYLAKMGRKRLCRAYVNLKAYEYFVKGMPVAESVFQFIEREYQYLVRKGRIQEQEEVCRLALLQHYAKALELTPEQRRRTEQILDEFNEKGMRFAFWKRFDEALLAPYQMEGHEYVEYVCNPQSTVNIYYRIRNREDVGVQEAGAPGGGTSDAAVQEAGAPDGGTSEVGVQEAGAPGAGTVASAAADTGKDPLAGYTMETMKNYFEGIFVREFTLFENEELECILEEELDGRVSRSDKRILCVKANERPGQKSKYGLLNQISDAYRRGDERALQERLESYQTMEYLAKEVFTLV